MHMHFQSKINTFDLRYTNLQLYADIFRDDAIAPQSTMSISPDFFASMHSSILASFILRKVLSRLKLSSF